MKGKRPKTLTRSRSRSYGQKTTYRQLSRQKQRAIEPARIQEETVVESTQLTQEVKPIENATPTETKTPWRAPRSKIKPDPGIYACRTIFYGIMVLFFLLVSFIFSDPGLAGHYLLFILILFIVLFIHSLKNSRGGW